MAGGPFSILLIDDDETSSQIFQMVLDHSQYPLTVVTSGKQALEYLAQHSPKVVIIDIFLPDLDGYRTFEAIRKSGFHTGKTFIATTAYYTSDTRAEAMSRGFDGYLAKPIDIQELVPYLEGLIRTKES